MRVKRSLLFRDLSNQHNKTQLMSKSMTNVNTVFCYDGLSEFGGMEIMRIIIVIIKSVNILMAVVDIISAIEV